MNTAWRHSFPLTALFESPLKIGEHRFKALCPAHLETHASCVVNYHRKYGWRWHCFACGADGDALDVLTKRDGLSWREAMEILGDGNLAWAERRPALPRSEPYPAVGELTALRGMAVREALDMLGAVAQLDEQRASFGETRRYAGSSPAGTPITAICDACRDEHATFAPVEYGNGTSRPHHSSTALLEAGLAGWEIAAGVNACVGPRCLERLAPAAGRVARGTAYAA